MSYVIRYAGLAGIVTGPGHPPALGDYLVTADVEAHDGRGSVTWSADPGQALLFDNHLEAFNFWRQQSTLRPVRPDGQPNRPLTAFSAEVVQLTQAVQEPRGIFGPNPKNN